MKTAAEGFKAAGGESCVQKPKARHCVCVGCTRVLAGAGRAVTAVACVVLGQGHISCDTDLAFCAVKMGLQFLMVSY